MSSVRRILVAVKNPAARSPVLVTKAAQLAKASGAELELFHALDLPVFVELLPSTRSAAAYEETSRQKALATLERVAGRLRSRGLRVTARVELDFPPAEAIVRRATAIRADLIVAGRHSGKHTMAWILGLTDWAERVLDRLNCDVLIVKPKRFPSRISQARRGVHWVTAPFAVP
jgi:nucleotide-binding universal stress UspA family protein